MRIAYVINSVEGGGAAAPVPAIARALAVAGAEVGIFALTRRDGRALPAMVDAGLEVAVRDGGERDHAAAFGWLDRSVQSFAPDLIWTSLTRATLIGQLVGARRRIPVVSWQHAAFLRPANKMMLRALRRMSALWIADSDAVAAFAARELGIPPDALITWPIFAADPTAPQATPWRRGEAVRIASLGRLHPVKGYAVLIDALARLDAGAGQPFEVTIGGAGAELATLTTLARRAGLDQLTFAGFTSDARQFLARAHLYVQPSRSEGFCVAAHEAIQAGLPVVASDVGGLSSSVVAGKNGFLVPPGDAAALAAALAQCLAEPERLAAMGQAGRSDLLERFSAEKFQATAFAICARLDALVRPGRSLGRQASDRSA